MPSLPLAATDAACCTSDCCDETVATSPAVTATNSATTASTAKTPNTATPPSTATTPNTATASNSPEAAAASGDELASTVREKYGAAARRVLESLDSSKAVGASCCGPVNSCCGGAAFDGTTDPITSNLYVTGETNELPEAAVLASLGCGNPTALAELREGEVVLDLGSGGGIDVLLSARRVGPRGKAYGLDMTDDMLALARRNADEAGVTNVEFLRGRIEEIPLPSNSVDVIISNCVVNLSGDKRKVLHEAYRVLKPGGRFAVSDVVVQGALPADVKRSMELWVGCVAGALSDVEFVTLLGEAGFETPSVEFTRTYEIDDARAFLVNTGLDAERIAHEVAGRIGAAFVRATKPARSATATIGTAAHALTPISMASAEKTSEKGASRSCGCDDGCCN